MTNTFTKAWKNENIQTLAIIGTIVLIFFGGWFGATLALNTPNPIVVVPTGSMCIPYAGACDGWTHPFGRTLHVGDLLILQGVPPQDLSAIYPRSDIIVFHEASNPAKLIVHRITAVQQISGVYYFRTKGDGNSNIKWPNPVAPEYYDGMPIEPSEGVAQDKIVGRVIFRIPWVGNIVLLMQTPKGIFIVAVIIALLLIVEFVAPAFRKKGTNPTEHSEQALTTVTF